ncbi:AsmA protein [Rhizobium pisi]|uniref:AsmA family protein n=1 Tax=Rhizobium pisi TaxID=574561 RepID=A0A3R9CQC9_9HYPH|nr:AsmA-like C-terminal region-containing protein [Rhizobium pisi]MBB3132311.1 AsmA protein [Rhizobium pisi]RSB86812.1 AsmA family protein [Rhizobium pisi]TCA62727.1 AsmA family protein [Rhizobium pisi]
MGTSRHRRWRRKIGPVSRWLPAFARFSTVLLLIALGLFVALRVAAPYLISTGFVRSGIEDALSKWTGYHAEIKGTPVLEFWPTPRITLNQVTIRQPRESGDKLLGSIESLSADFSLIDALRGRTSFHEFNLLRPNLALTRDENGLIDWSYAGLLARAISGVRYENGAEVLDPDLDAEIGAVTVEDGALVVTDIRTGNIYHFDSVTADIAWPRLSGAISAVVIARINGEDLKVDYASRQPLLAFAGKNAETRTSITSNLLTAHFQGIASIASISALSGNINATIPDVPSLLTWSGKSIPGIGTLKSASLESDIMSSGSGLRFNNLSLSLNDASATGVMDLFTQPGKRPKIGGTLAFDEMNLKPFLDAFALRLAAGEAKEISTGMSEPLQLLDVDVRLSARRAQMGLFELSDVGASMIVGGGEAKFDIGDSQFEGGEMTAHLEATKRNFDGGGKLQLSIRDADFAALAERLHLKGPLPLATGSLDLDLQSSKAIWTAGLGDVTGKLRFWTREGTIPGIDAGALRTQAAEKPFFPLSAAASGAFSFDRLNLQANFANGSAEIHDAHITGATQTLTLSGVITYQSNGLALSGSLEATDPAKAAELPPLPFFVGGSWPNPVISPVPLLNAPAKP